MERLYIKHQNYQGIMNILKAWYKYNYNLADKNYIEGNQPRFGTMTGSAIKFGNPF